MYEKALYRENAFFQSAQNVKKFGAYYTDVDHCRRIGNLFDFEQAQEICVLEPSVGDGSAVRAVTGEREKLKLYGVEIQKDTYQEHLKNNPMFAAVLNEDFLRGVKISHGVFSFCFANPPYGSSMEDGSGKRLEFLFLEKITSYLRTGAYFVFVIPYSVFSEEKFFRSILTRYELCSYYRFDDKEYEKYHQIVVILRKKRGSGYLRTVFEQQYQSITKLEEYPYLPDELENGEKYVVAESKESDIAYFTTKIFQADKAIEYLSTSPLLMQMGNSIFQPIYRGCDLNQPIVPLSNDIAYLLAVSGGGQGYAGSERNGTLHLQRGVAKRQEETKLEEGEAEEDHARVVSTSYTQIHLNIVENDGTITQL